MADNWSVEYVGVADLIRMSGMDYGVAWVFDNCGEAHHDTLAADE